MCFAEIKMLLYSTKRIGDKAIEYSELYKDTEWRIRHMRQEAAAMYNMNLLNIKDNQMSYYYNKNGGHGRAYGSQSRMPRGKQRGRKRTYRRKMTSRDQGYSRQVGYYGRYNNLGGQELKFKDSAILAEPVTTAGVIQESLVLIAQGVAEDQRIGRLCAVKSINFRYCIELAELFDVTRANVTNDDVVRVMVYLDKQCNGTAAAVTNILQTADFLSFNNLVNKGRFMILMDRTHEIKRDTLTINAAVTPETYSSPKQLESFAWYKKCNIPLEYNSTTGALIELRSNNIGVLFIGATGSATLTTQWRLRFTG